MYEISVRGHFDAAHFIRGYRGKCAEIHGHRWQIDVVVRGRELNELGILIDFADVKAHLKQILNRLDHKLINNVDPFDRLNPTAEHVARYVYEQMTAGLRAGFGGIVQVTRVIVWESEGASASYFEE